MTAVADDARYRALSLWWAQLPGPVSVRPSLPGDVDVDVVVVGGGFTGLWAAHSLAGADPSLRVAVLEAQVAGFGASGRNGGWCSGLFPVSDARLAREHGRDAARTMRRSLQAAVGEIGRVALAEKIDCAFAKGGSIVAARNAAQVTTARAEVAEAHALGLDDDDLRWMNGAEAGEVVDIAGMRGATFTPHCASLDPARLVRGLAGAVERRGVSVFERTPVLEVRLGAPGRRPAVRSAGGTVTADVVVVALEAWSESLAAWRRRIVPVYSLMLATEPLDDAVWAEIGLANRETFADGRRLVIYGQRTADGRIAFGGRGAPYHFASAMRGRFDTDPRIHEGLRETLVELFPALRGVEITHRWGGPIGVPRDWWPSVGLDRPSGVAWAGGYVGDGVAASNLAGRTLADLILGRDTELVGLPWVGHQGPRWEREPLRWMGINAVLWATKLGDRTERRHGRPSRVASAADRLLGG